ncbi:hypothetical protein IAU60_006068 [Kwoniella sp. DSM 27419]
MAPSTQPQMMTQTSAPATQSFIIDGRVYTKAAPMQPGMQPIEQAIRDNEQRNVNKAEPTKGWSKLGPCMTGMMCFDIGGAGR